MQIRDDILARLAADVESGQETLRLTLRRLVQAARPDLSGLLHAVPDAFLEPFAFRHFAANEAPEMLDQALAGYLALVNHPVQFSFQTDKEGRFYLPGLGYITAPTGEWRLGVAAGTGIDSAGIERDGRCLPLSFEPPVRVGRTAIELLRHDVLALVGAFVTEQGVQVPVDIEGAVAKLGSKLGAAFDLLREAWPALASTIERVVRRIVLFESGSLNSFSDPSFHGTAFLNAALGRDEVFLVEDLAHQCGHVLFFAATQHPEEYFVLPPSETLGSVIGSEDRRPLIVVLHGLVTEAFMTVYPSGGPRG